MQCDAPLSGERWLFQGQANGEDRDIIAAFGSGEATIYQTVTPVNAAIGNTFDCAPHAFEAHVEMFTASLDETVGVHHEKVAPDKTIG